jgi:hypothetical protein
MTKRLAAQSAHAADRVRMPASGSHLLALIGLLRPDLAVIGRVTSSMTLRVAALAQDRQACQPATSNELLTRGWSEMGWRRAIDRQRDAWWGRRVGRTRAEPPIGAAAGSRATITQAVQIWRICVFACLRNALSRPGLSDGRRPGSLLPAVDAISLAWDRAQAPESPPGANGTSAVPWVRTTPGRPGAGPGSS